MLQPLQKRLPLILLILFSSILFFYAYRPEILIPTFLDSVLYGDPAVHYLGWAFFRDTPWQFPLGQIEGYFHPFGTNVGFTDSIPLLAIPLKVLSPLLPDGFQFLGIWLYACYLLQGIISFKLFKELSGKNGYVVLLASYFLLLSSPLLYRNAHPALSAHWLLIGSIWCYLMAPPNRSWREILKLQTLWLLLSSWIHPYLAVMVLGLSIAVILKLFLAHKLISGLQTVLFSLGAVGLLFANWVVIGYFDLSLDASESTGYGVYAANLSTLWNSMGYSSFFEGFPLPQGHFEGFAYLGLGGMLVLFVGSLLSIPRMRNLRKRLSSLLPMMLLMIGFALFALSHKVFWNEQLLFQLPYPSFWLSLGGTFRASGRFIWPVYYFLLIGSLAILLSSSYKPRLLAAGLGFLLLVQLLDVFPLIQRLKEVKHQGAEWNIQMEVWDTVIASAKEVQAYPPFMERYLQNREDCIPFLYTAQKYETPITMGPVARRDLNEISRFTLALKEKLIEQTLDKDVLYMIPETEIDLIQPLISSEELVVGLLDRYYIFARGDSEKALTASFGQAKILQQAFPIENYQTIGQLLDLHQDKLILIAAMDEATYGLDLPANEAFQKRGSQLGSFPFRSSFLSIINQDTVLYEQAHEREKLTMSFQEGDSLAGFTWPVEVAIMSAGSFAGSDVSILIKSQELAPKARGLNIVVLDSLGETVEVAHFDTYISSVREVVNKWNSYNDN